MVNVLLFAALLVVGLFVADGSLLSWVIEKYYDIKGWGKFKHE